MAKRDDLFTRKGIVWQRHWDGGNEGRYVWRAPAAKAVAWRKGTVYGAAINRKMVAETPTLILAMDAVAVARMSRRRLAA